MIITDEFVFVHIAKCGGTFVVDALFKLYGVIFGPYGREQFSPSHQLHKWSSLLPWKHWLFGRIEFSGKYGTIIYFGHKHSTCREIPQVHLHKPIVVVLRDPYEWYLSSYRYGYWNLKRERGKFERVPNFAERYPTFPELSFTEFVHLMNETTMISTGKNIGHFTESIVRYLFKNPAEVFPRISREYVESREYEKDMFPVHLLSMDNLNTELYEFLAGQGYAEEDLAFIRQHEKINTSAQKRPNMNAEIEAVKRIIQEKDWFLYELFPQFKQDCVNV